MDRTSITICRIYAALNSVLTTDLTEEDLNKLENDIINCIDAATGKKTVRYSNKINNTNIENTKTQNNNILKENSAGATALFNTNNKEDKLSSDNVLLIAQEPLNSKEKQKRVRWDCKSCMNVSFKDNSKDSVCALCKKEFEHSGKTNTYYQRHPKEIPSHCGACNYVKYDEVLEKYVCTVNYFETDKVANNIVRANYMNKNKPNFCQM